MVVDQPLINLANKVNLLLNNQKLCQLKPAGSKFQSSLVAQ